MDPVNWWLKQGMNVVKLKSKEFMWHLPLWMPEWSQNTIRIIQLPACFASFILWKFIKLLRTQQLLKLEKIRTDFGWNQYNSRIFWWRIRFSHQFQVTAKLLVSYILGETINPIWHCLSNCFKFRLSHKQLIVIVCGRNKVSWNLYIAKNYVCGKYII